MAANWVNWGWAENHWPPGNPAVHESDAGLCKRDVFFLGDWRQLGLNSNKIAKGSNAGTELRKAARKPVSPQLSFTPFLHPFIDPLHRLPFPSPVPSASLLSRPSAFPMASLDISPEIGRSYQKLVSGPAPKQPSPTYAQWAVFSVSAPLQNAFVQSSSKSSTLKVHASGGLWRVSRDVPPCSVTYTFFFGALQRASWKT